jgi:hypothetical protein
MSFGQKVEPPPPRGKVPALRSLHGRPHAGIIINAAGLLRKPTKAGWATTSPASGFGEQVLPTQVIGKRDAVGNSVFFGGPFFVEAAQLRVCQGCFGVLAGFLEALPGLLLGLAPLDLGHVRALGEVDLPARRGTVDKILHRSP